MDASLQPATRILVSHSITIFYFIVYSWSCQLKCLVFLMPEFKTNTHCFVFIRSSWHPWIMDIDVRYLIQWLFVLRRYIFMQLKPRLASRKQKLGWTAALCNDCSYTRWWSVKTKLLMLCNSSCMIKLSELMRFLCVLIDHFILLSGCT